MVTPKRKSRKSRNNQNLQDVTKNLENDWQMSNCDINNSMSKLVIDHNSFSEKAPSSVNSEEVLNSKSLSLKQHKKLEEKVKSPKRK